MDMEALTSSSVLHLPLAVRLLADPVLLRVVHHLGPSLAAIRRGREKFGEGINQALGLLIEAQPPVCGVIALQGKEHAVVPGVALTG